MKTYKIIVNNFVYMRGVKADRLFIPRPQCMFVRNIFNFNIIEETILDKFINLLKGIR